MKRRPDRGPDDGAPGDGAPGGAPGPAWKRIAWFVLLWVGGVLTVAAVSYAIRLAIL